MSACSATVSRLQQLTQLETTRPHDSTPTGRRSPGLFVRFSLPIRSIHALRVGKVGHVAARLTSCYSIIVSDGGARSRTSSPPDGGDYMFLRLCGLRCAAAYLYLSVYRAHKHAHQLTRGRADARRSAEDAEGKDEQGRGREGAHAGGFTGRRCARGLGGAYDIGRDGTSSGGRAQAHSCGRAQAGGRAPGVFIW